MRTTPDICILFPPSSGGSPLRGGPPFLHFECYYLVKPPGSLSEWTHCVLAAHEWTDTHHGHCTAVRFCNVPAAPSAVGADDAGGAGGARRFERAGNQRPRTGRSAAAEGHAPAVA